MTPEEAKLVGEAIAAAIQAVPPMTSANPAIDIVYRVAALFMTLAVGGAGTFIVTERYRKRNIPISSEPSTPTLFSPNPGIVCSTCSGHPELVDRIKAVEEEIHEMRPEYERLEERTAHLINRLDNGDKLFRVLNKNMHTVCTALKVSATEMKNLRAAIDERKKRRE